MSEKQYIIPTLPLSCDVETKAVMKQTTLASRKLGELNGIVEKIPNPEILIRTLSLQEAMDSSSSRVSLLLMMSFIRLRLVLINILRLQLRK